MKDLLVVFNIICLSFIVGTFFLLPTNLLLKRIVDVLEAPTEICLCEKE